MAATRRLRFIPGTPSEASSVASTPSTMFSLQDPLLQRLKGLGNSSPSTTAAARLRDIVEWILGPERIPSFAERRNTYETLDVGPDEDFSIEIIDILGLEEIRSVHRVRLDRLGYDTPQQAQHMNKLLANIRTCTDDVHTRFLVLNEYLLDPALWTSHFDIIVFLHIMLVELGICVETVEAIVRPFMHRFPPKFRPGGYLHFGDILLGPARVDDEDLLSWFISATNVGKLELNGHLVNTVIICSNGCRSDYLHSGRLPLLSIPIESIAVRDYQIPSFEKYTMAAGLGSSTRSGMANGRMPLWTALLVQTAMLRYSVTRTDDPPKLKWDDSLYERRCHIASVLYQSANLDLLKIDAFLAEHCDFTPEECVVALRPFRILVERLRADFEGISSGFERWSTLRSLELAGLSTTMAKVSTEMAELSIQESRSTIRLTWLATFFIPVSLASSIFGMNVREINADTTGIWQFAATAAGLLALSAYSWCLMRALRNYNLCIKKIDGLTMIGWVLLPLVVYNDLYHACDESNSQAILYFLGFKRADELECFADVKT